MWHEAEKESFFFTALEARHIIISNCYHFSIQLVPIFVFQFTASSICELPSLNCWPSSCSVHFSSLCLLLTLLLDGSPFTVLPSTLKTVQMKLNNSSNMIWTLLSPKILKWQYICWIDLNMAWLFRKTAPSRHYPSFTFSVRMAPLQIARVNCHYLMPNYSKIASAQRNWEVKIFLSFSVSNFS